MRFLRKKSNACYGETVLRVSVALNIFIFIFSPHQVGFEYIFLISLMHTSFLHFLSRRVKAQLKCAIAFFCTDSTTSHYNLEKFPWKFKFRDGVLYL